RSMGAPVHSCPESSIPGAYGSDRVHPASPRESYLNQAMRFSVVRPASRSLDAWLGQRKPRRNTQGTAHPTLRTPRGNSIWISSLYCQSAFSQRISLAHHLRIVCRRRQDGRLVGGGFLLLDFPLRNQNGGSGGGNRHRARFGSAISVERFHRVARGYNFRERN